jgi:signal transduction histidine kinase
VKEMVNNTIKHSQANNVTVFLESHDNLVNLFYKDDGIGFNVDEKLKEKQGFGLNNIINKVETIKGICLIKSEPGQGMSVMISVKINV